MLKTLQRIAYDVENDFFVVIKDFLSFAMLGAGIVVMVQLPTLYGILLFSFLFFSFRWTIDKNLDRLVRIINEKNDTN